MNSAQFDRILRQVLILPIIVLLIAAGALFWGIENTNGTVRLIEQADDCIAEVTLVQKLVVDEETGLRGFQTTGDARFLDPFNQAEAPLEQTFATLEVLLAGHRRDLDDLAALRSAHASWHDGFARPVLSTVKAGGTASDVNLNLLGKSRMDAMRAAADQIVSDSKLRRTARIQRWRRQVRMILTSLLSIAALVGLAIGLFARGRLRAVSLAYGKSQDVLRARADELFASEQNLRITLASICDGVITCDAAGRVLTMNEIAQELTGWQQDEALDQPIAQVFQVVDEHTREPAENPATAVQRLNRSVEHAQNTLLLRKDGTDIAVDHNAAPIRDKNGLLTGSVTVFRDITTERKTQAALLANEKLAVAGRLAATIAHEIHNPLDSVANLLFLMETGSTPEETHQFLGMAQQELTRVTRISRAMLGLYRESNAPVPIDLHEMLADLMLLMERRFQTLGVAVTEEVSADLRVVGFPAELRQVFTNVLTNAAEAASNQPDGTVRVFATAQAAGFDASGARTQAGTTVCVVDNGPGIPVQLRDRLFHPFFTTKGEQGTGLGLWVCQGIMQKHGGAIQVESSTDEPGHGTKIHVFLANHPNIQPGAD